MVAGGVSSMVISCGHGGLASCHCVCQMVPVSPSTAFAPLPFSPAVSSLSTLTTLRMTFTGAADAEVVVLPAVWLLVQQPVNSAHATIMDTLSERTL